MWAVCKYTTLRWTFTYVGLINFFKLYFLFVATFILMHNVKKKWGHCRFYISFSAVKYPQMYINSVHCDMFYISCLYDTILAGHLLHLWFLVVAQFRMYSAGYPCFLFDLTGRCLRAVLINLTIAKGNSYLLQFGSYIGHHLLVLITLFSPKCLRTMNMATSLHWSLIGQETDAVRKSCRLETSQKFKQVI